VTRPFRITSHNEQVTVDGKTYRPFPVIHEAIAGDSAGNLPQLTLSLSNVSRELDYYIETGKGLSGNRVEMRVYNRAAAAPSDLVAFTFEIAGVALSDTVVTARLQLPSFLRYQIPAELFVRGRCRWAYKGEQCAYRGPIADCDKTLFGTNGCNVHGIDEESRGLPRLHPRRFGGFPGLLRFAV